MRLVTVIAGLCLTFVSGCERSHSRAARSSEATAFAVSICRYIARCVPEALNAFSGSSVAACEASFSCGDVGLAALAAKPDIDEEACSAEIDSAACGSLQLGSTDLAPRLVPKAGSRCEDPKLLPAGPHRAAGERCVSEEGACDQGLYCALDQPLKSVGGRLCGVCTREAKVGEACPLGTQCSQDAFCELEACVPRRELGAECLAHVQCLSGTCHDGACALNPYLHLVADGSAEGRACQMALLMSCVGDVTLDCVDRRCVRRSEQGGPCAGSGSCRAGLACTGGRCTALRCTSKVGAPCGHDAGYACFGDTVCTGPNADDLHCASRSAREDEDEPARDAAGQGEGPPSSRPRCDSSFDCDSGVCDRDIAPYCQLSEYGYGCSFPPCGHCGTCVPKPEPEACDEQP